MKEYVSSEQITRSTQMFECMLFYWIPSEDSQHYIQSSQHSSDEGYARSTLQMNLKSMVENSWEQPILPV